MREKSVKLNSCGECFQNKKSKFVLSININGNEVVKRCGWLDKQDEATKLDVCARDLDGVYPNASDACPLICSPDDCD